ncbi:hypothetical protein, partial [Salmonella enterica]|uniref:hypothetical protein n=1 Tax=Salmonella enterica TaxID=28901 RepID=UPI003BD29AC9
KAITSITPRASNASHTKNKRPRRRHQVLSKENVIQISSENMNNLTASYVGRQADPASADH